MGDDAVHVCKIGDFTTLPLYCMTGRLIEELRPLSSARVRPECLPPDYTPPSYKATPELLNDLGSNSAASLLAIRQWQDHVTKFMYYVQFKADPDRALLRALHDHTETLTVLCDSRLNLDPTPLWTHFDHLFSFAHVHWEYQADPERDAKWDDYSRRLEKVHSRMDHSFIRFIKRMEKQVELKAAVWPSLPPIHSTPNTASKALQLFYSYSHKDETLRDQLQSHLSSLKRQGVISQWHDRRISAGREWEGKIDEHLNSAHIILLLISSDFIASDYCYDVELKRAMERHHKVEARVIPVILRACDWVGAPFGKLQALPKDAQPVTSWTNIDEAFTDVAKGIRQVANELTNG